MAGKGNPANLKPFRKGKSGNPGGRPKEHKELRELAREHTTEAVKTLAGIMKNAKASAAARVSAATTLLERGWGRPLQQVEVKRTPFDDLSPDELRAVAQALESLPGEQGGDAGGSQGAAGTGEAVSLPTIQ